MNKATKAVIISQGKYLLQLRDKDFFESKLSEYRSNYKEVLLSQEEYFKLFSIKMDVFVK